MTKNITGSAQVLASMGGMRVDQVASQLFPDFSRARLQSWIKSGELTVDGRTVKSKEKLAGGEALVLEATLEQHGDWQPENIDVDIVFEDEHLLVVNKPTNLVVHPAAGNYTGTLVNALLYHRPELATLPRAGIVHRLDKETTGLMVVAKTLSAHANLVAQLQDRSVSREYEAVATGLIIAGGVVNAPLGRHPKLRKQMAVVMHDGKEAITHYKVAQRFDAHTHLRLKLETGRTHQIRVHMAHINHGLVGDRVYGNRPRKLRNASTALMQLLKEFPRQALHAAKLGLIHPHTAEPCSWVAPMPDDMQQLINALKAHVDE